MSDAPPAPVIPARGGQSSMVARRSVPLSAGLTVAGVHATFQMPLRWTRCTVVAVLQAPTRGRA